MQLLRPIGATSLFLLLFLLLMPATAQAQEIKPFLIVAAGDIAMCGSEGAIQTAAQIQAIVDTELASSAGIGVAALGDLAYESGTDVEFRDCYDPTWGRFLTWTLPVVGNHEYQTAKAAGYVRYFGAQAGDPKKLYYSTSLPNNWLFVALNSNCSEVGGCGKGSAGGMAAERAGRQPGQVHRSDHAPAAVQQWAERRRLTVHRTGPGAV